MRRTDSVHYLGQDGVVACKGIDFRRTGRSLVGGPPRMTIYLDCVTCDLCRARARAGEAAPEAWAS